MMLRVSVIVILFLASTRAVPTGEEGNGKQQRGPRDLSDEEHYMKQEHNPQYDHEAFLGKDQAERFDQLSPAEAKRRLGIIVDKIDTSGDGVVVEQELKDWVRHVGRRYIMDDVERHWSYHDKNSDGFIDWDEFVDSTFGDIEDKTEIYDKHRGLTYNQVLERDDKKFKAADTNNDKKLTKDEYASFLHPEDAPHMREIVVSETMSDMDRNKDEKVSLEEYLEDIWPIHERKKGGEEPEWLQRERDHFTSHRDKNKNGFLEREEISQWISPPGYDHAEAEAKHLLYEADTNKDKQLSKQEILDHQDVFVGSQATDFGDYFMRHDEF